MPSVVVTTMNDFRAALLQRESAQMTAMAHQWLGVEQVLQAQTDALALQMANSNVTTMGQLARMERYRDLRRQIDKELNKYADYAEGRITSGQRNMIVDALSHSQATVNAIATEAQITVPFNRLPVSAVENMVGLAGDGSPLRVILNDATRGAGDALGQQLVNGIALGRNPIAVARQAMRLGLGQSFTRMQNISRTEMLRTYRQASLTSYQSSNVVIGYKRLSARDSRTCIGCLAADGRVYGLEGFDSHVNCRCTMIPILKGIPPVQFETGQEWLVRQPESVQRSIMGPGRYDAWQSGRATLDDMVTTVQNDVWGASVVSTPVGALP